MTAGQQLRLCLFLAGLAGLIVFLAALTLAAQQPAVTRPVTQREIDDAIAGLSAYVRSREPA